MPLPYGRIALVLSLGLGLGWPQPARARPGPGPVVIGTARDLTAAREPVAVTNQIFRLRRPLEVEEREPDPTARMRPMPQMPLELPPSMRMRDEQQRLSVGGDRDAESISLQMVAREAVRQPTVRVRRSSRRDEISRPMGGVYKLHRRAPLPAKRRELWWVYKQVWRSPYVRPMLKAASIGVAAHYRGWYCIIFGTQMKAGRGGGLDLRPVVRGY